MIGNYSYMARNTRYLCTTKSTVFWSILFSMV